MPTALADDNSLMGSVTDSMIEKPKPVIEHNPRVPQKLDELIMQCVEIDPDQRPDSMAFVADRLHLVQGIMRAESERASSTDPSPTR